MDTLSAAYGGTSPKGRGKGPVLSFIVRNDRPFTLPPGEGFGARFNPGHSVGHAMRAKPTDVDSSAENGALLPGFHRTCHPDQA